MPDQNKNIDSYIEEKFRNSLKANTSSDFTFELLKRVALQKEFANEDLKTDRVVKYVIGGFISLLVLVTFVLGIFLKTNSEGREVSYFSSIIDKISGVIENISVLTMENLGFTFNIQTGIIIFLVMICIFIYSYADKALLKKN